MNLGAAEAGEGFAVDASLGGGVVAGVGLFADTLSLANLAGWNNLGDDHPLYSANSVSPILKVTATPTSFTFDLKQTLPIDFFEDDYPVQIKGILKGDVDQQGARDLWEYDITFTYESDVAGGADRLTADGFFTHLFAPHPKQGEITPSAPLDVKVTLLEELNPSDLPKTITKDGSLDKRTHPNGKDEDRLTKVFLQADQSEDDQFDNWSIRIEGNHGCPTPGKLSPLNVSSTLRKNSQDTVTCPICGSCSVSVPEPSSALGLLALSTIGAGSALLRKRQSKSEEN
ncbi:MAG: PEP-CTERM sorting domain-containing protein [Microcystaceae cyanobacterium]